MKKLYRAKRGQMIGGVCMGLAKYFDIDVSLVRLAWVILGFMGGVGLPAYIIAWIIIPEESEDMADVYSPETGTSSTLDSKMIGAIIIAVGVFLLLRSLFPVMFISRYFWPLVIVFIGVAILLGGLRGDKS